MRIYLAILLSLAFTSVYPQLVESKPLVTATGEAFERTVPDIVIIHYRVSENMPKQGPISASQFEQDKSDIEFKFVNATEEEITKCIALIKLHNTEITKEVSYIITLKNLDKYRNVIYNLLKLDMGTIVSIEFRTSKLEALKASARNKAILAARDKASALASALDQQIGKAYEIIEESSPVINWYEKPISGDVIEQPVNDIYTVQPGYITVTAKVTMSFELK